MIGEERVDCLSSTEGYKSVDPLGTLTYVYIESHKLSMNGANRKNLVL